MEIVATLSKLGDLGSVLRGVTFNADSDFRVFGSNNSIELLRSNNVQNNLLFLKDTYNLSLNKVKNEQILLEGDSLICMANGSKDLVGKSAYVDKSNSEKFTFGSFMGAFRPNDAEQGLFISYILQSEKFRSHINLILAGSSINNLTPSLIENYEFYLPEEKERKAIAKALSDVDELISKLNVEIVKNNSLFNELKQRLLYQNDIKKELFKVHEIADVDWGNTNLTKSSYNSDGEFLAVSATGIDGCIDHYEHEKDIPVISAIGALCGKMMLPRKRFTAIKNTITVTPKMNLANGIFLFYYLDNLELPIRGGAQPFISKGDVQKFEISIPDINKQNETAKILDDYSRYLEVLNIELAKYELIKQGMMNDLLTGKVRLG